MTTQEAVKILSAKRYCMKRENSGTDVNCNLKNCDECSLCYEQGTSGEQIEALSVVISALKTFENWTKSTSSDLVSRSYLLAEYDRQHQGPPGGARKIIEEAPCVLANTSGDLISRQAAKDAYCKHFCHKGAFCPDGYCKEVNGAFDSIRAEPTGDSEFWRKRAKDYEDMIVDLAAKISKGAKLESFEMNAEGLVFKMKEPPVQAEQKKGYWKIYVISMLDGEGCKCSECGFEGAPYWEYCPNCGAKMEGTEADES